LLSTVYPVQARQTGLLTIAHGTTIKPAIRVTSAVIHPDTFVIPHLDFFGSYTVGIFYQKTTFDANNGTASNAGPKLCSYVRNVATLHLAVVGQGQNVSG